MPIRALGLLFLLLLCQPSFATSLDMEALGEALSGWDDKKDDDGNPTAAKYRSADSNYRTYKPTVSDASDGGLLVSTKINHIRGMAKDDYAILILTFDDDAQLVSAKADVTITGKAEVASDIIEASAFTGEPSVIAAAVAAELAENIYNKAQEAFDHGGRKNFPTVIQHNVNWISSSVRR